MLGDVLSWVASVFLGSACLLAVLGLDFLSGFLERGGHAACGEDGMVAMCGCCLLERVYLSFGHGWVWNGTRHQGFLRNG